MSAGQSNNRMLATAEPIWAQDVDAVHTWRAIMYD